MEIIATIITQGVILIGLVLTFISTNKKTRLEHEEAMSKQTDELRKTFKAELEANKQEYTSEISEVKNSIGGINLCLASLQGDSQKQWALNDLRLQQMNEKFEGLRVSVESHNNFAQKIPVLTEKISVANHRIDDLEKRTADDGK